MVDLATHLDTQAAALEAQARALRALAAAERRRGQDRWVDLREAAAMVHRTPRYLRAQITTGKLAARGEGRGVLLERCELERWVSTLPVRGRVDDRDDERDVDERAAQLGGAA